MLRSEQVNKNQDNNFLDDISVKEKKIIEAVDDNMLEITYKTSDNFLNNSELNQDSTITNRKDIHEESLFLIKKQDDKVNLMKETLSNSKLSSDSKKKNWDDSYD